jgi:hypothetical protein
VSTEVGEKAAAKVRRVAGTTKARIAKQDATSARKLREANDALELQSRKAALKLEMRAAKALAKSQKKTRGTERRHATLSGHARRVAAAARACRTLLAENAASVYSSGIYTAAVAVAVSGQIDVGTERGWPVWLAVGAAAFLEGLALTMALTAHQLRMENERAFIPRVMTWVAAGLAAAINFGAHTDDLVKAAILGASSLAAILVWEVRSGAKHRKVLRDKGVIPAPPERFGIRRWLRYPIETWRAWSLDVKHRVGKGAAALIAQVQEDRDNITAATAADAALGSETAAEIARQAAMQAAALAVEESAKARAAARDAVKAAERAARPARRLRFRFGKKRDETPAPVPAATETPSRTDGVEPERSGSARPGAALVNRPETRIDTTSDARPDASEQHGSVRRTGSAKAEEDAALLERLKTEVPRDPDGTVPVRRAMRELGRIGAGRATRLLKEAKLHKPLVRFGTEQPQHPRKARG